MEIKTATHLGMCFGVRDAIKLAHQSSTDGPLTILGDLVHNPGVVQDLALRGVRSTRDLEAVQTETVMITAHGTSDRMRQQLKDSHRVVRDATCPLVHHAHKHLHRLVSQGFYPVIIGKPGHVEVNGMVGDLDAYSIVLTSDDVFDIPARPKLGIVAQTTQPIQKVLALVKQIQTRFTHSEVVFRDTVCQPTKDRQNAARELAGQCDVVVVIGGPNSNNTKELVSLCGALCDRVHHVVSHRALEQAWFRESDTVGVTAGTSTPPEQIQQVVDRLQSWSQVSATPSLPKAR